METVLHDLNNHLMISNMATFAQIKGCTDSNTYDNDYERQCIQLQLLQSLRLRMVKTVQTGQIKQIIQIKQDKCRSSKTSADQADHTGENQIK